MNALTRLITSARRWVPGVLIAALMGYALYRSRFAAMHVYEFRVQSAEIVAEVAGTGTLESRIKTVISPRIQERLAEVLVDQGDFVQTGQLLARLDDGELRRQWAIAEAALAGARSTANRVRVDEARAHAVETQARLDYARTTNLVANRVTSEADLDKAIEHWRIAEAELHRAQAATAEADQAIVTAERTLEHHKERLGFAELRSPYGGLIARRDRDPGGVVIPGSSIVQLIATNELWISTWIDETSAAELSAGQPARVEFRSRPEHVHLGKVARLGRETDRETREFLVDVHVDQLPVNWTLGQRAEVRIEVGRRDDALVIPAQYIHRREGRPGTWVREGERVSWRPLRLGMHGADRVEILEGLVEGTRVVAPLALSQPLRDGQRVATP